MSALPILQHPDPMLRRVCENVVLFDAALAELAAQMLETMYAAPGRGLAAPQIGRAMRLFVMDIDWKTGAPEPIICVNPVVTVLGGAMRDCEENCLSIPQTPVMVRRPAHILLHWQDVAGRPQQREFDGNGAVIVQHEADHLDGRLCIDYGQSA